MKGKKILKGLARTNVHKHFPEFKALTDFGGNEREKYLLSADYGLGGVYAYSPTHLGIQRIILPLETSQSNFENDQVKSVAIEYGEKYHGTLKRIMTS